MIDHPLQVGSLLLRPTVESDAEPLFELIEANRAYLRRWLPWLDASRTIEDARRSRAAAVRQQTAREALQVLLLLEQKPVGIVGFHRFDWSNHATSIGYWLAERHQGRGYMTQACGALLKLAFAEWRINRVEVRCATGNTRSRAIPERLGFKPEGTLRSAEWLYDHFEDQVVYSLLADEFNRRDSGPVDPLAD